MEATPQESGSDQMQMESVPDQEAVAAVLDDPSGGGTTSCGAAEGAETKAAANAADEAAAQASGGGAVEETPRKESSAEPAIDDEDEGEPDLQDRNRVAADHVGSSGGTTHLADLASAKGNDGEMLLDPREEAKSSGGADVIETRTSASTSRRETTPRARRSERGRTARGNSADGRDEVEEANANGSKRQRATTRERNRRRGGDEVEDSEEEQDEEEDAEDEEDVGEENGASNDGEDAAIRTYIRQHIRRSGGISTENVRKTFGIGWIRAKRLHDQEMGLKSPDEVRYASDTKLRMYIRRCFDEKGGCSVNHLRQEFSVGYNRAKKILEEEKERAEDGEQADSATLPSMGAVAAQLLGLGMGDDNNAREEPAQQGEKRRKRQRKSRTQPTGRPIHHEDESHMTIDDAHIQGLEEDASYLLGLGMGLNVAHRDRHGRTEAEAICENALQTLSSASGKSAQGVVRHDDRSPLKQKKASLVDIRQSKLERAREDMQQQLEEIRTARKRRLGSLSDRRRKHEEKALEAALGADMEKVKAKMTQIEELRQQLEEELEKSKQEREQALAEGTARQVERPSDVQQRKRKRTDTDNRTSDNLGDKLHKLVQTLASLQNELEEQHRSIVALPSAIGVTATEPLPISTSSLSLTSSLLTTCLLSLTSGPRPDSTGEQPAVTDLCTPPLSPPSPLPVTLTYSVPALSSQEFIKSLEALTASAVPSALSAFSPGSLSYTIPSVPPPSLASSLSFTSLPPPSPLLTYIPIDSIPTSLTTVSPGDQRTVFLPPPPLPTIPVASFPVFPYGEYVVVGGNSIKSPENLESTSSSGPHAGSSNSVKRIAKRKRKGSANDSNGIAAGSADGNEQRLSPMRSTVGSENRASEQEHYDTTAEDGDRTSGSMATETSTTRKRGRPRKNEATSGSSKRS